jgi:hypothetical protein
LRDPLVPKSSPEIYNKNVNIRTNSQLTQKLKEVKRIQLLIIIDFQLLLASSGRICNVELQNKFYAVQFQE